MLVNHSLCLIHMTKHGVTASKSFICDCDKHKPSRRDVSALMHTGVLTLCFGVGGGGGKQ